MNPQQPASRGLRLRPLNAALMTALIAAMPGLTTSAAAIGATSVADHPASPRYEARLRLRAERAQRPAHHRAPARAPQGATLPVTSCADDADPGTLRNVLAGAMEGDVVDLSALTCSTITLTQGPIDTSALGAHQLYDVTVQGPGRDRLTIDGGGVSQVFVVGGFSSDMGTFTANDLTIANGSYDGSLAACVEGFGGAVALNRVDVTNCHATGTYNVVFGGAVDVTTLLMTSSTITNSSSTGTGSANTAVGGGAYASDMATLVDSTVSGNVLTAPMAAIGADYGYYSLGGGLYVRGDLSMTNSTISGNSIEATADGEDAPGGGIYVRGIVTIEGSTIDNNRADGDGGGIFKAIYSVYGEPGGSNPTTSLSVTNSTFSGNTAARGGAIVTQRPLYLDNSTIADNYAYLGAGGVLFLIAGVTDSSGMFVLQSSIIADNTTSDGASFSPDLGADDALSVTGANSLVVFADAAIALPADTLQSDPLLLALADNGGPTRTMALGAGSPAIDAGNNAAMLAFDQRGDGFVRESGAAADIGAYEAQGSGNDDAIFADGFEGVAPPAPRD